jgi:hypothetical protein
MAAGRMQRRGAVLIHVQIKDDTSTFSNDHNCFAYLEVWIDVGSKRSATPEPATPIPRSTTPTSSPSSSARPSSPQGK